MVQMWGQETTSDTAAKCAQLQVEPSDVHMIQDPCVEESSIKETLVHVIFAEV